MNRFLKKLSKFAIILLGFFLFNSLINFCIIKKQNLPLEKTNILIVGDSHTKRSMNPNYFNNASNICQNAEPYILTYWKIKKIFNSFTPDTIVIGFSPHNISKFNDFKFSSSNWANEMFERSYTLLNINKLPKELKFNKKTYYKKVWKKLAIFPRKNHINYIGEYSNSKSSDLSDVKKIIDRHYYKNGHELDVSKISVSYLDSIVKLCESKKIKIILLASPLHKNYLSNIPGEISSSHKNILNKYSNDHITINWISNNYEDSLFLDNNHLNEFGAKKFAFEVKDFLKNIEQSKN